MRNGSRSVTCDRLPVFALILATLLPLAGCAGDDGTTDATASASYADYPGDAGRLLGLETSQVTGLLGPADFRRADGPTEILQYRGGTCVLDLYLYRDDATGDFRVRYIEARDRGFARVAPDTCLASVARLKRGKTAG